MIPSIQECFALMNQYRMLENIRAHSVLVAKAAHLIAQRLRDRGVDVSVRLATAGALMHDIGKTPSLHSGGDHARIGGEICRRHHLHEIVPLVEEHVRLKHYDLNGNYSEKEVVYYSDKRVNHDTIVSLDSRLRYILDRYGRAGSPLNRAIRDNFALCQKIEQKLFMHMDFPPESLADQIQGEGEICL
ncbi:MAG: HD domain-containing protein [Desulfobacteraceae bacterium]